MSHSDKIRPIPTSTSSSTGQYSTHSLPSSSQAYSSDGSARQHPAGAPPNSATPESKMSRVQPLTNASSLPQSEKSSTATFESPKTSNQAYHASNSHGYTIAIDPVQGSSSANKHGSHLTAQQTFSSPIKRVTTQTTLRPTGSSHSHQTSSQLSSSGSQIVFSSSSPSTYITQSPNSTQRQRTVQASTPRSQYASPQTAKSTISAPTASPHSNKSSGSTDVSSSSHLSISGNASAPSTIVATPATQLSHGSSAHSTDFGAFNGPSASPRGNAASPGSARYPAEGSVDVQCLISPANHLVDTSYRCIPYCPCITRSTAANPLSSQQALSPSLLPKGIARPANSGKDEYVPAVVAVPMEMYRAAESAHKDAQAGKDASKYGNDTKDGQDGKDKDGKDLSVKDALQLQVHPTTTTVATSATATQDFSSPHTVYQQQYVHPASHPQGYTHTPEVQAQVHAQLQNKMHDNAYNINLHDDIVESRPEDAKHPDRVRKREEFLNEHDLKVAPVNAKNTYENDMNPKIGQFSDASSPTAATPELIDAPAAKPAVTTAVTLAPTTTGPLTQLTAALEQLDLRAAPTVEDVFDSGYDSDEEIAMLANRLQNQIIHNSFPHINPPTDPCFRPDYVIGQFLTQVPIVSMLTAEECAIMGGCMRLHRYAPGDIIIRQGDVGRGFYIMKVGLAQVTRYDDDARNARVIDHIYSGEYFGEAALITNSPRGANVIAVHPCEVLFMHRDDFHILFDTTKCPNPIVFTKRTGSLGKAIVEEEVTFRSPYELKPPPNKYLARDPDVVEMLVNALRTQAVFTGMEHDHRLALIHHMWFASVQRGTVLIRQGDVGDNLYVLMQGKINVYIRGDDGRTQRKVDSFDTPGRCFGELALLYNTPRNATVIAKTDAHLWVLDRITFRRIMRNVTAHGIKKHRMMLRRVPLFETLPKDVMAKLAEATELLSFKDGDVITKQGDKPDGFYFVVSGLVHVVRKLDDGASYIVNQLQDGDYFGERALVEQTARSANVVSVGPAEVGKLDKYVFTNILLEKLSHVFEAKIKVYAFRDQLVREQRRDLLTVSTAMVERQRRKIEILANQHPIYKLDRLTRLGFLGKGGYGYVELVHNRDTDETFALKSLYRSHIIRTKSTFNVINEKKLLTKLRSPHIIRLYATFKDHECLYFLLEPCLGGELFTLLRVRTTFEDRAARFFAASVLLAIEEMHRQGVVYRDLKPENLLLDANGYVKVTDFGLSKEIFDNRTFTVCGTPHYLAPEVIKGIGHTKAVDLWCLGVLIYEMLAGRPPFYRSGERGDHIKLYKRIAACDYQPSSLFTPEAWDLIQRLLQPHEHHRLGYGGGEAFNDIKSHPWFLGFDWDGLSQRSVRAPIIPFLKTPEDTHNFKKENPNYVQPGKDMPAEGDQGWDRDF